MSIKSSKLTLAAVADLIKQHNPNCRFCEGLLNTTPEYYDHEGGFPTEGFKQPQWIYFTCTKCGHQWSLNHLLHDIQSKLTREGKTDEEAKAEIRRILGVK